ncbi:MAG TPA: SCP2 sterol-binding domain-containing protein [Actinomycetota bacterium]|nr:SCP2 sterol-binding domain-containing protein [Actinomycetota bacterium]
MASTEEVERKLEELITRLGSEAGQELGRSLPDRRALALHVGDLDVEWWTELEGGRLGPLRRGTFEAADIRITAHSDDLVELIDGEAALFSAYLAGRIRIEASFSDLLLLRRLV